MNRHLSPRYLIVGSGRMAQHLKAYLSLENQQLKEWSRAADPAKKELPRLVSAADVVLLLISDRALEGFYQKEIKGLLDQMPNVKCVHGSGSFSHPEIPGFHPLMSFHSGAAYAAETYHKMAFVGDGPEALFRQIFPSFKNSYFQISPEDKAYYHSLCVLGGNLSTWLWQQVIDKMDRQLHIPPEALWPYMDQLSQNLKAKPESALTGPVARGDQNTIQANLQALQSREELALENLYQAFAKGVQIEHSKHS